jgi:hypothetical protein
MGVAGAAGVGAHRTATTPNTGDAHLTSCQKNEELSAGQTPKQRHNTNRETKLITEQECKSIQNESLGGDK